MPATARKYGVSTIVALQNMAQLKKRYTAVGSLELQETSSNHLIGKSPYKVAKDWSERVGRREVKTTSHTSAKNQNSKTVHEKEKLILTPQETMDLGVGGARQCGSERPAFLSNESEPYWCLSYQAALRAL